MTVRSLDAPHWAILLGAFDAYMLDCRRSGGCPRNHRGDQARPGRESFRVFDNGPDWGRRLLGTGDDHHLGLRMTTRDAAPLSKTVQLQFGLAWGLLRRDRPGSP